MDKFYTADPNSVNLAHICNQVRIQLGYILMKREPNDVLDGTAKIDDTVSTNNLQFIFNDDLSAEEQTILDSIVSGYEIDEDEVEQFAGYTRAPSTNDDRTKGFRVNSFWTNVDTGKTYVALDVAQSGAIWQIIGSGEAPAAHTHNEDDILDLNHYDSADFQSDFETSSILDLDDIDGTGLSNGNILKYNSSSGNFEIADDESSSSIFGTEYNYVEDNGDQYTSGTTWVTALTLSVSDLPNGKYYFGWNFECKCSKKNRQFQASVTLDWSENIGEAEIEPKDSNNWYPCSGFKEMNISGDHNFYIDFRATHRSATAGIRRIRMVLWRIS